MWISQEDYLLQVLMWSLFTTYKLYYKERLYIRNSVVVFFFLKQENTIKQKLITKKKANKNIKTEG